MGQHRFTERTRDLFRRLRGLPASAEEARMLKPVALAGASRRSHGDSRLCSSFANTVVATHQDLERSQHALRRAESDTGAYSASGGKLEWRTCHMCERRFVVYSKRLRDYCSLDCKSASSFVDMPAMR